MSIVTFFKRLKFFASKEEVFQANATLYPDKILIETLDRAKAGFSITSVNIATLPVNTNAELLGLTLRRHLNMTRTGVPTPKDYSQFYKIFLERAGFKNGKEHHKNALQLLITQKQNQITIYPTKNGGYTGRNRGFLGIKNADIIVTIDIDDSSLGNLLREGWAKCIYLQP